MKTAETIIDQPIRIEQQELPLSGLYQCETCFADLPASESQKSRERYDNHALCFRHQLVYKKQQVREHRLAKRRHSMSKA